MIIKRKYGTISGNLTEVDVIHFETDSDMVLIEGENKNLTQKLSEIGAEKTLIFTSGATGTSKIKPGTDVTVEMTVTDDGHYHTLATLKGFVAERVLVTGTDKVVTTSTITATELGYLHELTGNVQSQLNGKAATDHGIHVSYSTAAPSDPAATASAGESAALARADHVHKAQTTITGNAGSATQLATPRNLKVLLSSGVAVSFDGSADVNIGVEGVLPVVNGGTGNSTGQAPSATKLATSHNIHVDLEKSTAGAFNGEADVDVGIKGTLGLGNGGTGATTAEGARQSIGAAASGHNHDSTYLKQAVVGVAGGLAPLGTDGMIPSSYLPSYVDDVIEGAVSSDFLSFTPEGASEPISPEKGKIYVNLADGKTYRWSGSMYVEISKSLALGDTAETAYRGDLGAAAYTHSQKLHAPADANKTEASTNNGKIIIAGTEYTVYTHPSITCASNSGGNQSLTSGGTFEALSDITVNANGHVTAKATKTYQLPSIVNIQSGSTQPTNQSTGDLWFQNIT